MPAWDQLRHARPSGSATAAGSLPARQSPRGGGRRRALARGGRPGGLSCGRGAGSAGALPWQAHPTWGNHRQRTGPTRQGPPHNEPDTHEAAALQR